jgi:anti-sigma-K factor RskA
MPDFLIDEDTDLLAAEFVLGTLDSEERVNALSRLRTDHGFIAMVRIWERRFGELHLMVEPVEPDAKILDRIKAKLATTPQNEPGAAAARPAEATASPDAPKAAEVPAGVEPPKPAEESADGEPPPQAPANGETPKAEDVPAQADTPMPAPSPTASDAGLRSSRRRWRALGVFMTLVVVGLTALLAAWRFAPQRLPAGLRPSELMMSLGILPRPPAPPARPQPPAESQFDE